MIRFYDTNALIDLGDKIFEDQFYIAAITLKELENIKNNSHKDIETKVKVRQLIRKMIENQEKYMVHDVVVDEELQKTFAQAGLPITPDNLICYIAANTIINNNEVIFVTGDISCYLIAKEIFKMPVEFSQVASQELYKGYQEYVAENDNALEVFYSETPCLDDISISTNEYIAIENSENKVIDCRKWNGNRFIDIYRKPFKSSMFGTVKALDVYQQMAFDSLVHNDITMLTGKAGTGKTTIPLAYAMQQIENQKYKKLIIIYSFETLKNAKQLGYIKGDIVTKIMETASIGNILSWKFGDDSIVKRMIASGSLEIIPTANIRGVEFNDSIIYITEGQNLDTYTLKTAIQRCKNDCKIIIEGDVLEQSDINRASGMLRMIDVFKGYEGFGTVKLKNVYRSQISELADKM